MRVNVTERDIQKGMRYDNTACPVALAIRRTLPDAMILTDAEGVNVNGKDYLLPPAAVRFALDFDLGNPVKPVVFNLETGDADEVAV